MPRTSMIQRGSSVLRRPPWMQNPVDLSFPDEWNYTFGIAVAAHPKLTLGFDIRGRTIRDMPRFVLDTTTYPNRAPGLTLPTASVSVAGRVRRSEPWQLEPVAGRHRREDQSRGNVPAEPDAAGSDERRRAEAEPHACGRLRLRVLIRCGGRHDTFAVIVACRATRSLAGHWGTTVQVPPFFRSLQFN